MNLLPQRSKKHPPDGTRKRVNERDDRAEDRGLHKRIGGSLMGFHEGPKRGACPSVKEGLLLAGHFPLTPVSNSARLKEAGRSG